jgi:hypothetical protein
MLFEPQSMFPLAHWVRILASLPQPAALISGVSGIVEAVNPGFVDLFHRVAQESSKGLAS